MLDFDYNVLLVDTSYVIYRRFFALKIWYKKQYPKKVANDLEYDWLNDKEFMDKYEKLFMSNITKICKKYNIPYDNIVFAIDCPHNNNWRLNENDTYKATRLASHHRNGFNSFGIFNIAITKYLPAIRKKYKSVTMSIPCCEADDIIGCLAPYINNIMPEHAKRDIFILANDMDYMQVCAADNIHLIDINCTFIGNKYAGNNDVKTAADKYLMSKLLMGDISDNINACTLDVPRLKQLPEFRALHEKIPKTKCTKYNIDSIINCDAIYKMLWDRVYQLRDHMRLIPDKIEQIEYAADSDGTIKSIMKPIVVLPKKKMILDHISAFTEQYSMPYIDEIQFDFNVLMMDFGMIPQYYQKAMHQLFSLLIHPATIAAS